MRACAGRAVWRRRRGPADGSARLPCPAASGAGPAGVVGARGAVARAASGPAVGARRRPGDPWVADFAEVVAVGLDAGLDLPVGGARLAPGPRGRWPARPGWPLTCRPPSTPGEASPRCSSAAADLADGQERRDLALLVAAWRLAEEVGAAASAVTASAASSVRERRAAADRTAVVVAGPRASMVLLSALPLAGPAAAAARRACRPAGSTTPRLARARRSPGCC